MASAPIEEIDVVHLAARAMERHGYGVTRHDDRLQHRDSGIVVRPQLIRCNATERFIQSTTAVMTSHPRLAPDGIAEFQHAAGDTLSEAVLDGLDQWVPLDFPVFLDALRDTPEQCMVFEMSFERGDDAPPLHRRAVLGPIGHFAAEQPTIAPQNPSPEDEHPFCPCCMTRSSFEAMKLLLSEDTFFGVRLFASRDQDGRRHADFRVNGAEWERGKNALIDYVGTWPPGGFELRKQYVILQTLRALGRL
jgi:hypothetical protein